MNTKLNLYTKTGLNPYAQAFLDEQMQGPTEALGTNSLAQALMKFSGDKSKKEPPNKSINLSSATKMFNEAGNENAGGLSALAKILAGATAGVDSFLEGKYNKDKQNALAQALMSNDPNQVALYDPETAKNMRDNITRQIMQEGNQNFITGENALDRKFKGGIHDDTMQYNYMNLLGQDKRAADELQYKYDALAAQLGAKEDGGALIGGIPEKAFWEIFKSLDEQSQAAVAQDPERIKEVVNGGLTKIPGFPVYFGSGKKATIPQDRLSKAVNYKIMVDENGNRARVYADGTIEEF